MENINQGVILYQVDQRIKSLQRAAPLIRHTEALLQFYCLLVTKRNVEVCEVDLLQVEDGSRDPLDTVHHPLGVWRPLAPHHYVLVQV